MSFIPSNWKTAAYKHEVTTRKVSIWGKYIWTCTCGASSMKGTRDLYMIHYKEEMDLISWLNSIPLKS